MTDSYTFNTPIGFLTIREEEQKLTELFWEANSVQTMKNELHSDFLYEVYTQVNEYLTGRRKQFDVPLKSGNAISTECLAGAAEDSVCGDEKLPGDCDWYRQ